MKPKATLLTGIVAFAVLTALSVYYYKERTVMLDVAFHLFSILKDNALAIQVNRFGAVVTQIVPLLASRAGGSLSTIALLYSASFPFFYAASFFLILLVWRNVHLALILLLYHTLMVTHAFFWIQCELLQGATFALIYVATIEHELKSDRASYFFMTLSPLFLITIVFFYPLLPFLMVFALAFLYLRYPDRGRWLLSIGLSYVLLYALKTLFFKTPYETTAMSGMKNFLHLFPDYFSIQANKNFLKWLVQDYYFLGLGLMAVIGFYGYKRLWKKLALSLGSFFALLLLINVTYHFGAHQFYLEPQYSLLSLFVLFPLAYDVLPEIKIPVVKTGIPVAIVVLAIVRIIQTGDMYQERVEWFRETISSTPGKVIFRENQTPMDLLQLSWGSAYEFWLLSTMETGKSRSIIIEERENEFDWAKDNPRTWITKWGVFPYDQLNPRFFRFEEEGPYRSGG